MANMSYCRFENTYQDLKDCIESIEWRKMFKTIEMIIEETESKPSWKLEYYEELKKIKSSVISKKDYDYYKSYELHNIYEHIPTNKFYKFKIEYSSWEGSEIVKFLGEVELKQIITTESKWIAKDKEEND